MSGKQPTRTVFLGDIPYDFGEAEVRGIADTLPVHPIEVRLVWDRERNRHKGYGFLEYTSVDEAIRARDALNGLQVKNRKLRADYSNDAKSNGGGGGGGNNRRQNYNNNNNNNNNYQSQPSQAPQQPSQPPAAPIPKNLVANDNISRTLAKYNPDNLLQAIGQMKEFIHRDQAQAYQVLQENQDLSYALVQAMLLMGLVDNSVVAQAAEEVQQAPPVQSQPEVPQAPAQTQQLPADPQEQEMIRQVLALTEEQMQTIPPDQRVAILAIRRQYGL